MKINLYSTFREHAGVKTIEVALPEKASVRWVIQRILETHPALRRLWLDKNNQLHGHVHIGLNQVDIMAYPDQMETIVGDKDVLDFFPPITGG